MVSRWATTWTRLTLLPVVWRVALMVALFIVSYVVVLASIALPDPSPGTTGNLRQLIVFPLIAAPLLFALLMPFAWPSIPWYWSALLAVEAYVLVGVATVLLSASFQTLPWHHATLFFWMWPMVVHAQVGCHLPFALPCWEFGN